MRASLRWPTLASLVMFTALLPGRAFASGIPAGYRSTGPIAFAHDHNGVAHIYLARTDGFHLVQLTTGTADDTQPAWSPSGTKIAFTRTPVGGKPSILVMWADGSHLTRIARVGSEPAWSFTGMIAFVRDVSGNQDIWTMAPDGTSPTDLITGTANDSQPAWSPDGNQLAFTSDRAGSHQIYTASADGSSQTQLTSDGSDGNPSWDPSNVRVNYDHFDGTQRVLCDAFTDPQLAAASPPYCGTTVGSHVVQAPVQSQFAWQASSGGSEQVFAMGRVISPSPGRSIDPAWPSMTATLRTEDHEAQARLEEAFAAATTWANDNGGSYSGADGTSSTGLVSVDTSLCYVGSSTEAVSSEATCAQGSGDASVSVYTNSTSYEWAASTRSSSGACFMIKSNLLISPTTLYGLTYAQNCDGDYAYTEATYEDPWYWT